MNPTVVTLIAVVVAGAPVVVNISPSVSDLLLGGTHGKTGQYPVFSPWSGIAREYGALPVVPPAQQDTARPPVPTGPLTLPADSSTTIRRPGGSPANVYYRNILELAFDDSTSGGTVRNVLSRYRATVIGGGAFPGLSGGAYVVQVPDPGRTFAAVQHLLSRLGAERGVHSVRAMMFGVRYDQRSHQQPSTKSSESGTEASRRVSLAAAQRITG